MRISLLNRRKKIGSSGGGSSSKSKTIHIHTLHDGRKIAKSYGEDPPVKKVIPSGEPFAGRSSGGGTRAQIFGNRTYGSGYPDSEGPGTIDKGFPFEFWPIDWESVIENFASTAYSLASGGQYGDPLNNSRPGGPLAYATFPFSSEVTFRVIADSDSVASLIDDLNFNCSRFFAADTTNRKYPNALSTSTTGPTFFTPPFSFNNVSGPADPQPEQVIQYYRASSISLTLDSYNNTATYAATQSPDSPLPQLNLPSLALMACLNQTIALAAPLISAGQSNITHPSDGVFGVFGLFSVFLLWVAGIV
ncbi:hypothetical protein CPB83DRAFT_811690 [Crepidotus variabilis]|uniref:Uncharacterized protein n=1 Tax=Crepidotus variabilis TaxID=179855 RepID=A0A9P6EIY0_9AGAR|nr:hypothetical protein CPB83DRAFT_811690 [Crepidotus variabilis]